ncbi:MAG: undecaprenyl-diphosphate phosphatase [Myxococcales bacterium]|nr:undecaprenyl-diphosphate phosphatase [Myxococcales bacterium]MCB9702306.1 undecaprenyl-diphosphate phosphatase [Myxococcales bacterium]
MPEALSPGLAAALGALQGVTEFLPISSSGHLSLAQAWLGVDPEAAGHRFNIVVHAGTLLAVLWVYRGDLLSLIRALLPGGEARSRRLLVALIVGTLPLGLALVPAIEGAVVAIEGRPAWIGVSLLVTAALLAYSHFARPRGDDPDAPPSAPQALVIGLFQLLAITPGISRSGSTIAAALGLGISRLEAARFSFLLSIPAILGASLKEVLEIVGQPTASAGDPLPYVIGFVTSLVVGLASLRLLVHLLVRVGLLPFVPYLVLLGLAAIVAG